MSSKISSDFSKIWNQLPPVVRLAIYGVGGFYAYTKLKSFSRRLGTKAKRDEALADAEGKGQKQTMGDYDYVVQAKKLYNSFAWYNDDEDAVYGVFRRIKNDVDYIKLDEAFYDTTKEDMSSYLISRLSNSEQGKVNEVLAKSGVKYRL